MMRKIFFFLLITSLFSCKKPSQIETDLGCKSTTLNNLEEVVDFKESFSINIPKHWKTNLYYDSNQSSIFSADTTKQLSNTYLIDITLISQNLNFKDSFLKNFKQELLQNSLIETSSYKTSFLDKETYYSRSFGKKRNLPYQIINLFIKTNKQNYLHAKAEVYGDSLANERLCEAISLIKKTTLLQ